MKKILLLIATCVLLANTEDIKADGVYAGATGGLNWIQEAHKDDAKLSFKRGYIGAVNLGYRWDCGLRLETEVAYRYNKMNQLKGIEGLVHPCGKGRTWSYMANVLYSFPVDFYIKPYVGAGIGYAHAMLRFNDKQTGLSVKAYKDGFAHQFIAGAEFPLSDCLSLDTKYRYQKTHDLKNNQSVETGLVYSF